MSMLLYHVMEQNWKLNISTIILRVQLKLQLATGIGTALMNNAFAQMITIRLATIILVLLRFVKHATTPVKLAGEANGTSV